MNRWQKAAVALTMLAMFLGGFVWGTLSNRQQMLSFVSKQFKQATARTNLGRYVEYKEIAVNVSTEKYARALCLGDLGAK